MESLIHLKKLPRIASPSYGGRPGQGHPDEEFINKALNGKHWTDFSEGSIAELLTDDIPLISINALTTVLPALILSGIYVLNKNREDLYHFVESVDAVLSRDFWPSDSIGALSLATKYSEEQVEEILGLLDEMYSISITMEFGLSEYSREEWRGVLDTLRP